MDDLISRQVAIKIIKNYCENGCDIAEDNWCPSCQREQFIKLLEVLPSAQPEQRWIPCSERLPEYGIEVLTINKDDEYEINHIIDDEDGEWFWNGAVAWMPLPEPYKEYNNG